jgi:hypothetical protein
MLGRVLGPSEQLSCALGSSSDPDWTIWMKPTLGYEPHRIVAVLASFLNLDDRSPSDDLRQHWDLLRSPDTSFLPDF